MSGKTIGISFRPSASDRWSVCTASVKAVADCPADDGGNAYADEGSVAHLLLEATWKESKPPGEFLGYIFPAFPAIPVDAEMVQWISAVNAYITSVLAAEPVLVQKGEIRLDIDLGVSGYNTPGTADFLICSASGVLHVMDLKYGRGKMVSAQAPQLQLYGVGALQLVKKVAGFQPRLLRTHVMQPRLHHWPTWDFTMDEVTAFAHRMQDAVLEALSPEPVFHPTEEACQWCPIKAECRARTDRVYRTIAPKFATAGETLLNPGMDLIQHNQMSGEELGMILKDVEHIQEWCGSVKAHAYSMLERDSTSLPGWKLVAGRGNRSWADEEDAKTRLAGELDPNEYMVSKLISPAQAEKLVGKATYEKVLSTVVEKREGKPTLAPEEDKRAAVGGAIADKFTATGDT